MPFVERADAPWRKVGGGGPEGLLKDFGVCCDTFGVGRRKTAASAVVRGKSLRSLDDERRAPGRRGE